MGPLYKTNYQFQKEITPFCSAACVGTVLPLTTNKVFLINKGLASVQTTRFPIISDVGQAHLVYNSPNIIIAFILKMDPFMRDPVIGQSKITSKSWPKPIKASLELYVRVNEIT